MKIGICTSLDNIAKVRDMGFDYIEGNSSVLAGMTPEQFAETQKKAADAGLPVYSFACLFPWSYKFFSTEITNQTLADHLKLVFEREAALGGRVSVFGSGGARKFPEGVSYPDACKRVVEVLRLAGDLAAPHGISIVFEPLCRAETNIGNSVCEGSLLVQMANHPNVGLLADYYHMATVGEPVSEIARIGGIRHAHIATRDGRHAPLLAGSDDFAGFLRELKTLGTCEGVSIESGWTDFDRDAPRALALLRSLA